MNAPLERQLLDLGDLLTDMYRWVPNAFEGDMRAALREVAVEFCRDTGAFTDELTLDLVASQADYDLDPYYAAMVHSIQEAKRGTTLMSPTEYHLVDGDPARFRFVTAPSVASTGGLTVLVQLVPLADCEEFPEAFLSRWRTALVAGAVTRLTIPGAKNADVAVHKYFKGDYRAGLADAAAHRLTGGVRGSVSMMSPMSWI